MTALRAWIVASTGLEPANVWRAYQNSGHDLPDTINHVTYFEAERDDTVFLSTTSAPDPEDDENVIVMRQSQTQLVYRIRVFGPDRAAISRDIRLKALEAEPRQALAPAVFQRVTDGPRLVREENDLGWLEYETFDVLLFETTVVSENVPIINGSDIGGTLGDNLELEVIEP